MTTREEVDAMFDAHGRNTQGGADDESAADSSSSDEGMETLYQIFKKMDPDRTGFVTLEQMVQMEKEMAESRDSVFDERQKRVELKEFLMEADLDENHMLDFDEFVAAMKMRENPEMVPYIRTKSQMRDHLGRPAKQEIELRKMRLKYSLVPTVPKTEQEKVEWEKKKATPVDPQDGTAEEQLHQVFDSLDVNAVGLVAVEDVVSLQKKVAEKRGDKSFSEERTREAIMRHVTVAADGAAEVNYEEFVEAVVKDQGMNHEQLRATCEVIWSEMQQKSSEDLDMKSSLESLRAAVLANQSALPRYTPYQRRGKKGGAPGGATQEGADDATDFAPIEIPELDMNTATLEQFKEQNQALREELHRLNKQSQTAMGFAESLMEKYEKSKTQIQALEKEVNDLTLQLKNAGAVKPGSEEEKRANIAERQRTHKQRNQEFFFLTTLSIKMELEAKYKARGLRPPGMKATKKLYEEAMAARVPFQYYARFIRIQLDPVVKQKLARKKKKSGKKQEKQNGQ